MSSPSRRLCHRYCRLRLLQILLPPVETIQVAVPMNGVELFGVVVPLHLIFQQRPVPEIRQLRLVPARHGRSKLMKRRCPVAKMLAAEQSREV